MSFYNNLDSTAIDSNQNLKLILSQVTVYKEHWIIIIL